MMRAPPIRRMITEMFLVPHPSGDAARNPRPSAGRRRPVRGAPHPGRTGSTRDRGDEPPRRSGDPADSRGAIWRSREGFSLIEVMVAMVVVSAGALAVAASMLTALSAGTMAGEQTRATSLAVQKLEELKARPPTSVDDEVPVTVDVTGDTDPNGPYTRWVEVVDESEGAAENTRRVTVVVQYESGKMGTRTVELFTILYADDG